MLSWFSITVLCRTQCCLYTQPLSFRADYMKNLFELTELCMCVREMGGHIFLYKVMCNLLGILDS